MVGVVGINHKSAPVEVREKLVMSGDEALAFAKIVVEELEFAEVVVLSTCNRTEVYYSLPKDCEPAVAGSVAERLIRFKSGDININKYFYHYSHSEAAKHLFNVAAGLNSMVLGEDQVLGQVKEAYRISSGNKLTGVVLNRLFHKAFEVGKRVRTETKINEGASSLSYAAVELASKIFRNLSQSAILLIGAGETGELLIQSLVERGCKNIYITNRTFSRAQTLAEKYKGEPLPIESAIDYLIRCDIVVVSTSSPEPLILKRMIADIMKRRKNRAILLIDLSVPRGIEPDVKEFESVFLYDVDDLETVVKHNYEKRKGEIAHAEKIIQGINDEFSAWLSTLNLTPTIEALKNKFQNITGREIDNLRGKIPEEQYNKISEFGNFLNGKYLGILIKNLKILSNNGKKLDYIDLVNNLFELNENNTTGKQGKSEKD